MFRNYLTIAIRNLLQHTLYSLINISSLAIGMACCILILLFIQDELSYDRFHEKADRIYRVLKETRTSGRNPSYTPLTPGPLAPTLRNDFPEVQQAVRRWGWAVWVQSGDKWFREGVMLVDENMLDVFDFPLIRGERETALRFPFSAVITDEIARKYFGDEDPLGKTITIDRESLSGTYQITGVLDGSVNSALGFPLLISNVPQAIRPYWDTWQERQFFETYVVLPEGYPPEELERKLPEFIEHYLGEDVRAHTTYRLQPLTRIHLYSNADYGIEPWRGDNIAYVYMISIVGFFILLIACINFMNLATARSANRAKEVGMRKVVGAHRYQLIQQFLAESMFIVVLSLFPSFGLAEVLLPTFNSLSGKELSLTVDIYTSMSLGILGLTSFVSILSGSYLAFFLSAFQPVDVLKGGLSLGKKNIWFRKGLVVFQFSASILLIIGTGVVYRQLEYIGNKKLGFNKDHLIVLPVFQANKMKNQEEQLSLNYNIIKQEFLQHSDISKATAFRHRMGSQGGGRLHAVRPEGVQGEDWQMRIQQADEDFLETYEIELIAGRNFSVEISSDATDAFILNETAVKQLGWKDPIGKHLEITDLNRKGTVIGVAKDFHGGSLYEKIGPVAICMNPPAFLHLALRVQAEDIPATLDFLEEKWDQFIPNRPFRYYFMDEWLERMYREEIRLGNILVIASSLAIFIACLGLFGLASFTAEQRTKEIGIRKVLGASVGNVMVLLSREFTCLVIAANLIAWPIAYYTMNGWLQNFAYRIDLGIEAFLLGGILTLFIALATVSYQAIKAALANPVDALRYE